MRRNRIPGRTSLFVLLFLAVLAIPAPTPGATRPAERARNSMVAGPESHAVDEAVAVLREGGSAVDAAVTMGFVLAVTYPQAGNIGGGGYMLVRKASGETVFIDYRETAPAASTAGMFLDEEGDPIPRESLDTYRAAGVPGSVAGLTLALSRHGTIPLKRAMRPAIRLAREGFTISRGLEASLKRGAKKIGRYPASKAIFFSGEMPLGEGDLLVQTDLARTLETIAEEGADGFYKGRVAHSLEEDMRKHGGLITAADLASYRPILRDALTATYRGYEIVAAPPSSSGGVTLIETLHMLEPHDLASLGHNSSAYIHLVAEATKRAYADRARWLGDPDFYDVPLDALLSTAYASSLMSTFDPDAATPAQNAGPGNPLSFESTSTTHFSIIDAAGNAVSNTTTLNGGFGCGAVATGLGFFLNNEMDDFAIKPDTPNLYGLVGGEANAIAPGKRMLSSMTPTIVLDPAGPRGPARPFLVLGTPGGGTIITSVLQTILNVIDFDMELNAAVDAPRFHHQWKPDLVRLEKGGFSLDTIMALKKKGHETVEAGPRGDVQAVLVDREAGWILGASDARGWGKSRGD